MREQENRMKEREKLQNKTSKKDKSLKMNET